MSNKTPHGRKGKKLIDAVQKAELERKAIKLRTAHQLAAIKGRALK